MDLIKKLPLKVEGKVRITNDLGHVLLDKKNAVHFENMSITLARGLAGLPEGRIFEMHFGNGGTTVDSTGNIVYFPLNIVGSTADLYRTTYFKVVNQYSPLNPDPSKNFITVKHSSGDLFSDIEITCTLDFGEPQDQDLLDISANIDGNYVFDEIGLKSYAPVPGTGLLLTHINFSPIQKSQNRQITIEYVLRIQAC